MQGEGPAGNCFRETVLSFWVRSHPMDNRRGTSLWFVLTFPIYETLSHRRSLTSLSPFPSGCHFSPRNCLQVMASEGLVAKHQPAPMFFQDPALVVPPAEGSHLTGAALMYSTHSAAHLAIFENQRRPGALRNLCRAGPTQLYFGFFACLRNIFHCFEFDENMCFPVNF